MSMIKCIECGKRISDKAEKCPNCGCPIKNNTIIQCPKCQNELNYMVAKCPNCGLKLKKESAIGIAGFAISVFLIILICTMLYLNSRMLLTSGLAFIYALSLILLIISFALNGVSCSEKKRTHGYATAGFILSGIAIGLGIFLFEAFFEKQNEIKEMNINQAQETVKIIDLYLDNQSTTESLCAELEKIDIKNDTELYSQILAIKTTAYKIKEIAKDIEKTDEMLELRDILKSQKDKLFDLIKYK